jgi:small nuclear ribonucleoprotein (snRNP)-like protein
MKRSATCYFLALGVGNLAVVGWACAAEAVKPPVFELRAADGSVQNGSLRKIDAQWNVVLGGVKEARVPGAKTVSLRRTGALLPPYPDSHREQVLLANGSRLAGKLVAISGDRLQLRPMLDGDQVGNVSCKLPMSAVSVIWLAAPSGVSGPHGWLRRLLREERANDVIWLRNGDHLEGTLLGMSPDGFRIKTEGNNQSTLERTKVAVVALNTELVSRTRPKGLHGHVVLANGSRLLLTSAHLADGGGLVRGRLPTGADLDIPVSALVALDLRYGCAVDLSDLKPSQYEHTPFSGLSWPYVVDGNVAGRDLRVGGGYYDKGLGLHSQSRLSFALSGGYQRLEALVGLDDRNGRLGRARIQVLLDDKPADLGGRRDSLKLSWQTGPQQVRVDVAGKRKLTLIVDYDGRGDVQGYVNWVDARLIRPNPQK